MKATIHDAAALRTLGPLDVAAYLRSSGWRQVDRIGDRGVVWTLGPAGGAEFEMLVPLSRELGDFVPRMADVLRTLEIAEQRSQLEILRDLTTLAADVIRVRALQPDVQDGTIPLDEGVQLVQRAQDMLLAAACAAVQPKAYFPTRKPSAAVSYMEHVRLGQTERGSFVVTLLSRVPPGLEPGKNGQGRLDVEDPFERQATRALARALAATRDAAQEAAATGEFAAFQSAVASGVSANLCEALAGMAGGNTEARELGVSLAWSPLRPLEAPEPSRMVLTADAIPIIREAGRLFREAAPREEFELRGVVIGLRRDEGTPLGRVTITAVVDDTLRKVQLDLADPDYTQAVEAHKREQIVLCEGELAREGRSYSLRQPRNFRIEGDV